MRGDEFRRLTRNILRTYRAADEPTVKAGMGWYPEALWVASQIGLLYGWNPTQSVVALAHLSPRVTWSQNLRLLEVLLGGSNKPRGALARSWETARRSLAAEDPLMTFGKRADKTRSFAQAILGDTNAVVVDVWAARAAGIEPAAIRSRTAYQQVGDAYRRAGLRAGLPAREVQAIAWIHVRTKEN